MLLGIYTKLLQLCGSWSGNWERSRALSEAAVGGRPDTAGQRAAIQRALIDALPANIALLDADGDITLVNKAWQRFASANDLHTPDFCVGVNYLQVCQRADQTISTAAGIRQVLAHQTPTFRMEYPCHSATEERWFELIAAPLDDAQGPGAIVSHVDITRSKLAERGMLAGALQLADAQQIAHVGSWEFDTATMRGLLSDEMRRLSYCQAPATSIDFADFIVLVHADDRQQLTQAFLPGPDAAEHVVLEYRTHPSLGRERLISAVVQLVRASDGSIMRTRGTAQDVSARRRAEETLRVSEERFATAFSYAPIGIALVAPDGHFLKANYALCALLGYAEAKLLSMTFEDVTHPDDLALGRPMMDGLMTGKFDTFQLEKRYVRANGEVITALLDVALVRDRGGKPKYQIAHIQDCSARKSAELAIAEVVERLSEAQRIGQIGDWSFDLVTQVISWSPQVYSILGRDPALGPPHDYADNANIYDDASQQLMAERIALAIATGVTQDYELMARRSDGEQIWLQAFAVPDRDPDGQIHRLHGTVQDITQRKRGQLLSARMAAIIDSSEDAIISEDLNGVIISWNKSAERIFGYTEEQMVGQSTLRLIPLAQHTDEITILRLLRDGQRIDHFETKRLTSQGKLIDVSLSISLVKDEYGNIIGASKVLRDISERRQTTLQLQGFALRLQHLSRRLMSSEEEGRRRLGRDLHDQTGSNLTAITLNLQILRSQLPPEVASAMKLSIDNLDSLLRGTIVHIRDVLSDLRPPALDEFGVLAALRYYAERIAAHSDLKMEIDGTEPSPRLQPEVEIALFRIAQEALTNVLKHAQAHCVRITLSSTGTRINMLINDDGRGFDRENDIAALCSLGMTTMQERAQAIGANMELRSALGAGTQISVTVERLTAPDACTEVSAQ